MINIVKAAFDISLHKPSGSMKLISQIAQRRMAAAIRPEAVRGFAENWLINRFQQHPQDFLNQFVREGWDSQRTLFTVLLLDVRSSYRFWLIASICEGLDNPFNFLFTKAIRRIVIHSTCGGAVIGIQVLVCHIIDVLTQQISIQFCEHFFMVLF